jgi:hypothetical protein
MRIDEVADPTNSKLLGLAEFLMDRSVDTNSKKQISVDAFINLARNIGVTLTPQMLTDLADQSPLNSVFDPIEPGSSVINFKGSGPTDIAMPVNKAQDVVASAAKSAMKRGLNK